MSFLHFLFDSLFSILFPKECIGCGALGTVWCERCRAKVEISTAYLCPGCFKQTIEGVRHDECREKVSLDGFVTALDWKDKRVKDAIHLLKYEGVVKLAGYLAGFLYAKVQNSPLFFRFISECHALVPVPLHRRRLLFRGYNQSELLARELSKNISFTLRTDIVNKARRSKTQTKLKGQERFKNVSETFELSDSVDVSGARIVLLDDVVTSGATMNEIAKVLKRNGASLVWGLAVTRG